MSRSTSSRHLAANVGQFWSCSTRAGRATPQWTRAFSQSQSKRADDSLDPFRRLSTTTTTASQPNAFDSLAKSFMGVSLKAEPVLSEDLGNKIGYSEEDEVAKSGEPYHFHIYSHKHNTHVTVTKPNRDAVLSLSCGNLGFKKSQRKHYDSAYQLGAYALDRLYQNPHAKKIKSLEVVLRGFGPGREAVTKVLLGTEGKWLRDKIVKVSDATRLKFGGTRSPKPRRLG